MVKRRPFLLLELLIALMLVMLFSVELMRNPVDQLKKEIDALVEFEAERLWLLHLMEVRQKMPGELESYLKGKESITTTLKVAISELGENNPIIKRDIVKKYIISKAQEKTDPGVAKYFCMRVTPKEKKRITPKEKKRITPKEKKRITPKETKSKNVFYDFFIAVPEK